MNSGCFSVSSGDRIVNVDKENAGQILHLHNLYTQKMKVLRDLNAGQRKVILDQTEKIHSLSMEVITWSGNFTTLKNNLNQKEQNQKSLIYTPGTQSLSTIGLESITVKTL